MALSLHGLAFMTRYASLKRISFEDGLYAICLRFIDLSWWQIKDIVIRLLYGWKDE